MKGLSINIRTRSKARYHRTRSSFRRSVSYRAPTHPHAASSSSTPNSNSISNTKPNHKSKSRTRALCSRLKRLFSLRMPSHSNPNPNPNSKAKGKAKQVYRDEKKYHHVPVHAASTFLNSTTTGAMVDVGALDRYEPVSVRSLGDAEMELVWDEERLVGVVEEWRRRTVGGEGGSVSVSVV